MDVDDGILNFVWNQFSKQHQSQEKGELCVSFFLSLFCGSYHYSKVSTGSQTYLGSTQSPLDYDVTMFLRNVPGH